MITSFISTLELLPIVINEVIVLFSYYFTTESLKYHIHKIPEMKEILILLEIFFVISLQLVRIFGKLIIHSKCVVFNVKARISTSTYQLWICHNYIRQHIAHCSTTIILNLTQTFPKNWVVHFSFLQLISRYISSWKLI